jgi:hypothetical protein
MNIPTKPQKHTHTYRGQAQVPMQARKREFLWLIGLILSFAHERPILVLTSMYRINPRLFDVKVMIEILFALP